MNLNRGEREEAWGEIDKDGDGSMSAYQQLRWKWNCVDSEDILKKRHIVIGLNMLKPV